ncbi:hypothetical protein K490DRAFT_35768 [Saccharata proteae CBS 121410]|uniref:DUF7053 domain-containing protein n=1 Tax=Saccharata proteae CBS 121410 TaxID=1314787 RepID=A0A9P4HVY4_9PEZI|nr:hypothetical protein K490DRAFT_35768 [Saccharata proteae CBS 121410]
MPTTSVSTPIPSGLTEANVLAALHNHELMIKTLAPSLISYELQSGDASSSAVYNITDKKPIGQTTYKLTLTNCDKGIDSLVNANPPVGTLTIAGQWRIDGNMLREDVEIDGNMLMKKMAKGNVDKTHPEQHAKLLDQVKA